MICILKFLCMARQNQEMMIKKRNDFNKEIKLQSSKPDAEHKDHY